MGRLSAGAQERRGRPEGPRWIEHERLRGTPRRVRGAPSRRGLGRLDRVQPDLGQHVPLHQPRQRRAGAGLGRLATARPGRRAAHADRARTAAPVPARPGAARGARLRLPAVRGQLPAALLGREDVPLGPHGRALRHHPAEHRAHDRRAPDGAAHAAQARGRGRGAGGRGAALLGPARRPRGAGAGPGHLRRRHLRGLRRA